MLRRLFFVIPDVPHAERIVDELKAAGIGWGSMHASSKPGVELAGLPVTTEAQGRDRVWSLDKLFWKADLALFVVATLGLLLAAFNGALHWVLVSLAMMLGSFVFGNWFFVKIPHVHLADMQVPLAHGEVVLMVDVPMDRVRDVEQMVCRRHPEADMGGVGWSSPLLGT